MLNSRIRKVTPDEKLQSFESGESGVHQVFSMFHFCLDASSSDKIRDGKNDVGAFDCGLERGQVIHICLDEFCAGFGEGEGWGTGWVSCDGYDGVLFILEYGRCDTTALSRELIPERRDEAFVEVRTYLRASCSKNDNPL